MVKVKKSVYLELVFSALLCAFVSLCSVLYLVSAILELRKELVKPPQIIKIFENVELVSEAKDEVEKEETIEKAYSLTSEERELLAKLLYCEGRGESVECQRAIVSVVMNRLDSGKWGNDLKSVIYAKGQFEPVARGLINKANPSEKQYEAIDYVIENGVTIPTWVQFFRASYHFNWKGYTGYIKIDNTYFGGYNG